MRVGLALPHYDSSVPGERPLPWPTVRRWARAAEDLGFGSLWVSDHLFVDAAMFGGPPGRVGAFDALPLLGALARVTRSPRLGTSCSARRCGRPPSWPRRWPPSTCCPPAG